MYYRYIIMQNIMTDVLLPMIMCYFMQNNKEIVHNYEHINYCVDCKCLFFNKKHCCKCNTESNIKCVHCNNKYTQYYIECNDGNNDFSKTNFILLERSNQFDTVEFIYNSDNLSPLITEPLIKTCEDDNVEYVLIMLSLFLTNKQEKKIKYKYLVNECIHKHIVLSDQKTNACVEYPK
jgi:hypothetical protein